ncbi:hypothetical protein ACDP63_07855 [Paracoccus sp. P2]|uniref:Lipoprotein n=1 Tax=Paracoccus pantotrophus TaxID=82367 RepID=A0A7H9BV03_PARPN|nr:hypothetical protein [Paracoccus pantotrophus]QLH14676.1 hypothetical protein HYQ43_10215 [Paracoccus pantotrophus]WGR64803.1 hypothetical protein E3U24_05600 [Paracoccus pantotrophus]
MKLLSLIALAVLSGCVEEDIAYRFVAKGNAKPLSLLASEAQSFVCVVAIYRASPSIKPPELANGFEPWSSTPLSDRVNETAVELRALNNAGECWDAEIRKASGSPDPWHYTKAVQPMISSDHSGNVAVFDPQRGIFIAISG